jgi:hypothetical protein
MGRTDEEMCPLVWKEPVIDDDPFDEDDPVDPPYQVGETYWCRKCNAYSKDFYASTIARRIRQCKVCKTKKRRERERVTSHLSKLRAKLFKSFNRRGFKGHRSVFKEKSSLINLIKSRGLRVRDVLAIIPPSNADEVSNMKAYAFKLRPNLL